MRVLCADSLADIAVERLEASGVTCDVMPSLTADDLPGCIAGHEALVVRSTKVTAATLEAGTELGLVVRAGAGTNTIDCERAAQLGVLVCNVPGRNAIAVAELALGLMLAVDRHIAAATADARSGSWDKKTYSQARGLYGATLGIIGMGAIGLEVAQRAAGCGMRVMTVDKPVRSPATLRRMEAIDVEVVSDRISLLKASDVVSLHVPAGPDTAGMVDTAFLAAMKRDAVLINTSRGEVVDEAALIAALDSTDMRAGLDVFVDEPRSGAGEFRSALASHPKVTVTHHVGASTRQAQTSVAEGVVEVIESYRRGSVINCVNLEQVPEFTATLSVRMGNRVGVLAQVLQELRSRNVNVTSMGTRMLSGSAAAGVTIDIAGTVDDDLLDGIRAVSDVIQVTVLQ